jgi:heptosyltransferase I
LTTPAAPASSPAHAPRILLVKLSSLGDVVHAMPVVHDILTAHPGAQIDWVVEPAFAPLVRRVHGINTVIECSIRRWRKQWWRSETRVEWAAFLLQLRAVKYDAVIDLQGLTKSAVVARLAHGLSHGLAHATDGSSFEAPARWLVDHAVSMPPHVHAVDRSRQLVAAALKFELHGSPLFGLKSAAHPAIQPTIVFIHGTSRDDKLWPEAYWIGLGQRLAAEGWRIAVPRTGDLERTRANRIANAIGPQAEVWPAMNLDALTERMQSIQAAIGVDSGLSHIAVALNLPHVQIYNFPTAWRTGPQPSHGHLHQVSVEPAPGNPPAPSLDDVWAAWQRVMPPSPSAV